MMLNQDIIQGKWNQVKGKIRKTWGSLTDNEIEQAKGNVEKFVGTIQSKYGGETDSIRKQINDFVQDMGTKDAPERKDLY